MFEEKPFFIIYLKRISQRITTEIADTKQSL